ncbi:MAG: hypothetical protein Q8Q81_17320 [Oxalobacteraceae bacterium]|nr:hypothetical protein [Oxalobacteraceae bacterium]
MAALNRQYSVTIFITKNASQIRRKSYKLGIEFEDAKQNFALFILENAHKYDPARGSFEAFVFGSMEKIMRRQTTDALLFASSIEDQGDAETFLSEHLASESLWEDHLNQLQPTFPNIPGVTALLTLAESISGKSSSELSAIWGVTKRRVNQILKRARDDAQALALSDKNKAANG